MPWAAVGAVAGVAGLVSGLMGSSKAADAAKDAKRLEKKMTREQMERLGRDQERDRSMVDVLQAASGFSAESVSSQAYRQEFVRLQGEEMEWLKLVGASRYNQQAAKQDAYKFQGIAGAFGDVAGIAQMAGSSSFIKGLFGP